MSVVVVPTFLIGFKFWWALMWRSLLVAIPVGLVVGTIFGIARAITDSREPLWFFLLCSFSSSVMAMSWMYARLLRKGFGKYRIALTEVA